MSKPKKPIQFATCQRCGLTWVRKPDDLDPFCGRPCADDWAVTHGYAVSAERASERARIVPGPHGKARVVKGGRIIGEQG